MGAVAVVATVLLGGVTVPAAAEPTPALSAPASPASASSPAEPEPAEPEPGEPTPGEPMEPAPVGTAPVASPPVVPSPVVPSPVVPSPVGTPPAPSVRILPLGDSLTWGKGSTDRSGYRAVLRRALVTAGVRADFVGSQRNGAGPDTEHEGRPGWRIEQVHAYAARWVTTARPEVILLDIGTNDYVQRYDEARAPDRLAALVDRLHAAAPRAEIVLAKLLVIAGDRRSAGVRRLNAAIPRIAAARRGYVTVADMSRIPVTNTGDGVHPTDFGYRQMAYQWYQVLRRVLPGGPSWPGMADPFPVPAVRVSASGGAVRVTLAGRLTPADLGNVTVRLRYRRAGTQTWVGLGTARTGPTGVAWFRPRRPAAPGVLTAVVVTGRAAGRMSGAVRS